MKTTFSFFYWLFQIDFSLEFKSGAGDGNRTHVVGLEGRSFTIKLHPQRTVATKNNPNEIYYYIIAFARRFFGNAHQKFRRIFRELFVKY